MMAFMLSSATFLTSVVSSSLAAVVVIPAEDGQSMFHTVATHTPLNSYSTSNIGTCSGCPWVQGTAKYLKSNK